MSGRKLLDPTTYIDVFNLQSNTCFNYQNMLLVLLASHFATVRASVMAFSCETIACKLGKVKAYLNANFVSSAPLHFILRRQ